MIARSKCMKDTHKKGRVTIPTDLDVVPETLQILEKWGGRRHPRLRRHRVPRPAAGHRRQDLFHLLHHPQGQRLGQSQPRRDPAVLHHDRLLHCPGGHGHHPPDAGHQPRADAGEHPGRHRPLVGGGGPHHRPAGAPRPVELCRRQRHRPGRTLP